MAHYYQDANALDYTPSGADVAAGALVQVRGDLVGCAVNDIVDGVKGAVQIRGAVEIAIATGVSFTAGDTVGYDAANDEAVAGGAGDYDVGSATFDAAAANGEKVHVILNL